MIYETVLGVMVGLGLAAACGFRVFVPLLVLAVAARAGQVSLGSGMSWIGSDAAIVAFATASLLEVVAYWVPWLDHALDVVASPAAVVAGSIVAGSQFVDVGGSAGPMLRWAAAIVAGGGLAGAVQATSVATRAVSTVTTAGMGNPIVSAAESVWAVVMSIVAVVAPIAAGVLVLVVLGVIGWRVFRWRGARNRTEAGGEVEVVERAG